MFCISLLPRLDGMCITLPRNDKCKERKHICVCLGALSDADNELKTKPGCEAKIAQYPEDTVDTFTVQQRRTYCIVLHRSQRSRGVEVGQ